MGFIETGVLAVDNSQQNEFTGELFIRWRYGVEERYKDGVISPDVMRMPHILVTEDEGEQLSYNPLRRAILISVNRLYSFFGEGGDFARYTKAAFAHEFNHFLWYQIPQEMRDSIKETFKYDPLLSLGLDNFTHCLQEGRDIYAHLGGVPIARANDLEIETRLMELFGVWYESKFYNYHMDRNNANKASLSDIANKIYRQFRIALEDNPQKASSIIPALDNTVGNINRFESIYPELEKNLQIVFFRQQGLEELSR